MCGSLSIFMALKLVGWVWWLKPVIPAFWDAEVGRSLEPGTSRLPQAVNAPLHSNLGDKPKTSLKKEK